LTDQTLSLYAVKYNSCPVNYKQLGKTDIRVSQIGFGCWAIGGPVDLFGVPVGWGGVDDRESEAAIHRALELGINFFDTADVYGSGHSEELLGRVLPRTGCVIATKAGNARKEGKPVKDFSESHIRRQLEQSLLRLRRETVDIFQLHNPPPEVWQNDEIFSLLQKLKEEGKIRVAGVSITTMEEGIHLIQNRKVDLLQVLLNILNQAPIDRLLPVAEEHNVGMIARVPLASGLLTGKYTADHNFGGEDNRQNYLTPRRLKEVIERVEKLKQMIADSGYTIQQVALAFLFRFPVVPIPGAKSVAQLEQNFAATNVVLEDSLFHQIRKEFGGYNFFLRHKVHV
jgi:aryl-alcohol dehydrogenase-like predicted oxidoreductase